MRKIVPVALLSVLMFLLSVTPTISQTTDERGKLLVVDPNLNTVLEDVVKRSEYDEDLESLKQQIDIAELSVTNSLSPSLKVGDASIAINVIELSNNKEASTILSDSINSNTDVYIYGENLNEMNLQLLTNLPLVKRTGREVPEKPNKISNDPTPEKIDILGFNGNRVFFQGRITYENDHGETLKVTSDIFLQEILSVLEDRRRNKVLDFEIQPFNSDTIVASSYNNTTSYYWYDSIGGNTYKKGELGMVLLLTHNVQQLTA